MKNLDWLDKKTPRSVKQLKLWPENPRLNPDKEYFSLKDYADELMSESSGELKAFKKLVSSIAKKGFIPLDPIVVWQNEENEKFYVAEGNRRILALKLLLEPSKSPKWIRSFFLSQSKRIDHDSIEKIKVYVAPSMEEAEWYISERNNGSSLQKSWSRLQIFRWVEQLFDKYDGDIETIISKTNLTEGELTESIRHINILNLINDPSVKEKISNEVLEEASSHRFPTTIIERFFSNAQVKKAWGIEFDCMDIKITSNKESFYTAFASLVERITLRAEDENPINTRTITSDLGRIMSSLPAVDTTAETIEDSKEEVEEEEDEEQDRNPSDEGQDSGTPTNPEKLKKGDIRRDKMILSFYEIQTGNARLKKQFDEFKQIPFSRYESSISASLRVFLDLAILDYIKTNELEDDIKSKNKGKTLVHITLKNRLEYLKQFHLTSGSKAYKNVTKLIGTSDHYSLDTLNGYIHSNDSYYISKEFLNGFWDFLFPLFEEILVIKEN